MLTSYEIFAELPVLETERLKLRRIRWSDTEDVFRYASDPEVAQYTMWDAHRSLSDSRDFIACIMDLYVHGQPAPWGIIHKGEQRLIGTCGFVYWNVSHARAEIGYALGKDYWGQGYATEAVQTVVGFGFRDLGL